MPDSPGQALVHSRDSSHELEAMPQFPSGLSSSPKHSPCSSDSKPVSVQEYVSLNFTPDGKMLLAQAGGPDWNLLLWVWEKSKVASSIRSTTTQTTPVAKVREMAHMQYVFQTSIAGVGPGAVYKQPPETQHQQHEAKPIAESAAEG